MPDNERERVVHGVIESWPFSPELMELLENNILLAESAQDSRDLIRILAEVYRSRGENVPLITPADFFVDDNSGGVQSLLDSIATVGEQERLREVAQRNLENIQNISVATLHARELISALWMRSMSPSRKKGGTSAELHLDITRDTTIDSNEFNSELNHLIENSINIHGDSSPGGYLYFGLDENPCTKVRAIARNDKLWASGVMSIPGGSTYPGKDIEFIQKTLRYVLIKETKQPVSHIIVLGPHWRDTPWLDVPDTHKPNNWEQPVLIVVPEGLKIDSARHIEGLGEWLARHVPHRRNTVRFLLSNADSPSVYYDHELVFLARCAYLTVEAWKSDPTYAKLRNDFEKPLQGALFSRFDRFAILRHWNYPTPAQCIFDVERIAAQGNELALAVDQKITDDLFDPARFRSEVEKRAKDSWTVGDLLKELAEPPPSPDKEAIPFLGEREIYERILEVAAKGQIALNVDGKWHTRPVSAANDEQAKRELQRSAFRSGAEMRAVQLGLPTEVGGTTMTPLPTSSPKSNQQATPTSMPSLVSTGTIQLPGSNTSSNTPIYTAKQPTNYPIHDPSVDSKADPSNGSGVSITDPSEKRQHASENTGINLSGNFEKWGIGADQPLDTARIEFKNITAQQMKQILQRIPPQLRVSLEVIYSESDEI